MKKTTLFILSIILIFTCVGCVSTQNSDENYALNVSYGLGGDVNRTVLSIDANIGSLNSDVRNIDTYEVLINEKYSDLLLENGPYDSKYKDDYMQVTGTIVFDTTGMSKEEIHEARFFEGFKIIDKDGNETNLYIPADQESVSE